MAIKKTPTGIHDSQTSYINIRFLCFYSLNLFVSSYCYLFTIRLTLFLLLYKNSSFYRKERFLFGKEPTQCLWTLLSAQLCLGWLMCINVSPAPSPPNRSPPPLHTHIHTIIILTMMKVFLSLQCLSPTLILPLKPPPPFQSPAPFGSPAPLSTKTHSEKKHCWQHLGNTNANHTFVLRGKITAFFNGVWCKVVASYLCQEDTVILSPLGLSASTWGHGWLPPAAGNMLYISPPSPTEGEHVTHFTFVFTLLYNRGDKAENC